MKYPEVNLTRMVLPPSRKRFSRHSTEETIWAYLSDQKTPLPIMWKCSLIVSVVPQKSDVGSGDWRFDSLSGIHHQSQANGCYPWNRITSYRQKSVPSPIYVKRLYLDVFLKHISSYSFLILYCSHFSWKVIYMFTIIRC